MRILGIETSCDDTGAAIYDRDAGLLAHALAGQVELHREYGGVVPELAARDHLKTLLPLIDHLLKHPANNGARPDAVAYTAGPGLAGALLVGAAVGASLARAWRVPAVAVHHMEGHLLAPMLAQPGVINTPLLALLVSGGHTMLVDVAAVGDYRIIGRTLDDAAGEAFDKTAKLLQLGFPGGPAIAAAALHGNDRRFTFARPMTDGKHGGGLDFSFSGLKTQVRTQTHALGESLDRQTVADIALAFEQAVVDTLAIKCARALEQTGRECLVVSGGVGANARLRRRLRDVGGQLGTQVFYPPPELCTDNGAMIAFAGCMRLEKLQAQHELKTGGAFDVRPRWSLEEI